VTEPIPQGDPEKLDVHNTAELVRYAARRGLLP
jgi:hypothetical protein